LFLKIVLGSDHAGFELKEGIRSHLSAKNIEVIDVGAFSLESVHYPDFAFAVASKVACKEADFGVLVCGTGIRMSICANKVDGIRAALANSVEEAVLAREHNDANVLCLGSRSLAKKCDPSHYATTMVDAFLSTPFSGGRHGLRVNKIIEYETASKT